MPLNIIFFSVKIWQKSCPQADGLVRNMKYCFYHVLSFHILLIVFFNNISMYHEHLGISGVNLELSYCHSCSEAWYLLNMSAHGGFLITGNILYFNIKYFWIKMLLCCFDFQNGGTNTEMRTRSHYSCSSIKKKIHWHLKIKSRMFRSYYAWRLTGKVPQRVNLHSTKAYDWADMLGHSWVTEKLSVLSTYWTGGEKHQLVCHMSVFGIFMLKIVSNCLPEDWVSGIPPSLWGVGFLQNLQKRNFLRPAQENEWFLFSWNELYCSVCKSHIP